MNADQILKLKDQLTDLSNLDSLQTILEKKYEISYGQYESYELKKAITESKPVIIKDHFLTGFEAGANGRLENSDHEPVPVERMVKAIIIEEEKSADDIAIESHAANRDPFAITGKVQWANGIPDEYRIIQNLRVGEVFLPPHSVIVNFLNGNEETKNKKIVSELAGINVNIYSESNCIDNAIHEIGHLFWRDCVNELEKQSFKLLFSNLKPSAIYEYTWEHENTEEVFCTIYKWYVKSILINKSFYNILEFEEPKGLQLLQDVISRIAKERQILSIWKSFEPEISDYINPRFDRTTNKYLRKAGVFEKIRDIEIPAELLLNPRKVINGVKFISFGKSKNVPIAGDSKQIDWEKLNFRAIDNDTRPVVYVDLDGTVADFNAGYKMAFDRDIKKDDAFTVNQFLLTEPRFFRYLPIIEKGLELVDILRKKYHVIFLTTPLENSYFCVQDKIEWVNKNFGDIDIIFSDNKSEYVDDESSVLIDDRQSVLKPWSEAGGTAINFTKNTIEEIIAIVEEAIEGKESAKDMQAQISEMEVETNPTEKQKETGNYKKGDIIFRKLKIKIENPKGSIRFGIDGTGKKWISRMKAHYGYILGPDGTDGDKIDVFIGPEYNKSGCFVINQNDQYGQFDEHKVILCCNSLEDARALYLSNYQKGWETRIGSIEKTNVKKLRDWLKNGNLNEPFKEVNENELR